MATKSISKSIKICDEKAGRMLYNAIESSYKDHSKDTHLDNAPQRVEKKDIRDFFRKIDK